MKILIIDNADVIDGDFNKPLAETVAKLTDCTMVNFTNIPVESIARGEYDGIIVSGVPLHYSFESLYDRLNYLTWIRQTTVPVMGICLGHQIIGTLFGSLLIRDTEAEDGLYILSSARKDPIFNHVSTHFEVRSMHRASITVPDEFELLARSDKCANIIMKHRQRDIYGFQVHPEFSSVGVTFFSNFIAIAEARRKQPDIAAFA
ncbi:MAG TPA: gamma-glutamyl-gamma-aminobutyrate hydrolase family protein [Candidatus Saccharimonadales bacterium]|nr:gamma-glutamyl-gamma-aminobutyrate hydrolase family protein [Candidatus Saccharimonadales bacterium]